MKLLVVLLYLVAGPSLFIRCEVGNDSHSDDAGIKGEEPNSGGASIEERGQVKNDLGERALRGNDSEAQLNKIDTTPLDHLEIGGRALRGDDGKSMSSNKTEDALDKLDIGGRVLRGNDDGGTLRFGKRDEYVAKKADILGEGGFGKVYKALDTTTGEEVAVKVESKDAKNPSLLTESKNYDIIGHHNGIPRIHYFGTSSDGSQVLVMQLLKSSLADLQKGRKKQQFSPKTVYMIGIQLLQRIEMLHKARLVHRDIKPGNMGIGQSGELIYIFDFGQSIKYVDDDGRHIPEGPITERGAGDMRYMSVYAHKHKVASRRDDLWSIGFVLMSFLRGDLPWYKARGYDAPASKSQVVRMKENLDIDKFCEGHASEMARYFKYVGNELEFKTRPNYSYLRKLFTSALSKMDKEDDKTFDWHTESK